MGDVLRTTCLLTGLKRKYPDSYISWLVDEESEELLSNNQFIDRIIVYNLEEIPRFLVERYDVVICLDKEIKSTALATKISAREKYGFGINQYGSLTIFNKASEYAFRLGIDNNLKFYQNQKTYPQLIYEMCELDYQNDEYILNLEEENKNKVNQFFKKNKIASNLCIGLNTGAGTKFETKRWPEEKFLELIGYLGEKLQVAIFLLGGEKEREINKNIEMKSNYKVYNTGSDNSPLDFAGFISLMDLIVSSDSLAMHLAIALKKKVIVLFGPTCPQEIELYSRGKKIFTGVDCSPCYKQFCPDMKCMKSISAKKVFQEIENLIKK